MFVIRYSPPLTTLLSMSSRHCAHHFRELVHVQALVIEPGATVTPRSLSDCRLPASLLASVAVAALKAFARSVHHSDPQCSPEPLHSQQQGSRSSQRSCWRSLVRWAATHGLLICVRVRSDFVGTVVICGLRLLSGGYWCVIWWLGCGLWRSGWLASVLGPAVVRSSRSLGSVRGVCGPCQFWLVGVSVTAWFGCSHRPRVAQTVNPNVACCSDALAWSRGVALAAGSRLALREWSVAQPLFRPSHRLWVDMGGSGGQQTTSCSGECCARLWRKHRLR